MKIVKFSLFYVVALTLCLATVNPSIASVSSPKRGDCYNYTQADTKGMSAKKGTVACSAKHTQETYRVATWPSNKNPYKISDAKIQSIAEDLCQPWNGTSQYFNYWNYYLPTQKQWNQGFRWLRCDAAIVTGSGSWKSWRGKILDVN